MKSIQNTLGAMAIFAGMFAGSTFAEETQTAKPNTQTAAATAVGNTAPNGEKVVVEQANLRKEKTKEELAEEKRLNELREFVKDKKVEKFLITKRNFGIKNGKEEMVLDVEKAIIYARSKEKLAQKVEKDFIIKEKSADITYAENLAETAEIQERIARLKEVPLENEGMLTPEELAEEKRLRELREFVKHSKVEASLIKRYNFGVKNEKEEMVLDVEKAVSYLRGKEKLAQQVEKDFIIVKPIDIIHAEDLAEIAQSKERTARLEEEGRIARANTEKNNAEVEKSMEELRKKASELEIRIAKEKDKKNKNKK